jgi:hypothetical protein
MNNLRFYRQPIHLADIEIDSFLDRLSRCIYYHDKSWHGRDILASKIRYLGFGHLENKLPVRDLPDFASNKIIERFITRETTLWTIFTRDFAIIENGLNEIFDSAHSGANMIAPPMIILDSCENVILPDTMCGNVRRMTVFDSSISKGSEFPRLNYLHFMNGSAPKSNSFIGKCRNLNTLILPWDKYISLHCDIDMCRGLIKLVITEAKYLDGNDEFMHESLSRMNNLIYLQISSSFSSPCCDFTMLKRLRHLQIHCAVYNFGYLWLPESIEVLYFYAHTAYIENAVYICAHGAKLKDIYIGMEQAVTGISQFDLSRLEHLSIEKSNGIVRELYFDETASPNLTELVIDYSELSTLIIERLTTLEDLTIAFMPQGQIQALSTGPGQDIKITINSRHLRRLYLFGCGMDKIVNIQFRQVPDQLTSLESNVSNIHINCPQLVTIVENLTFFGVYNCDIITDDIIAAMKKIVKLELTSCQNVHGHFTAMPSLRELSIENCHSFDNTYFDQPNNLQYLRIQNSSGITSISPKTLQNLKTLQFGEHISPRPH